jgi:predicted pyridoxine 5'-phosphate oxidase superfamily flavin-nucleotide-binding protein
MLQDQFDTRRLADRIAEVKVHERLSIEDRQFIERMDMFFLATVDGAGQPTCSYKGGDPGFVAVLDDTTLAFPNYDGNGMYLSMGNLAETRGIGMLFVDFELQRRLRIDGTARVVMNDPLLERYPEAQFIVRVEAARIYPNCPRYIHKHQIVERSAFVPRGASTTPIPAWKQASWASDVLPANDPAHRK